MNSSELEVIINLIKELQRDNRNLALELGGTKAELDEWRKKFYGIENNLQCKDKKLLGDE